MRQLEQFIESLGTTRVASGKPDAAGVAHKKTATKPPGQRGPDELSRPANADRRDARVNQLRPGKPPA